MTLNGWFIFNGVDTRTLGVTVVPGDLDQAPARNFLVYPKGSANGDFAVDTAGYNNVLRTYWIMIRSGFREKFDALCNALLPVTGYARLEDMWSPDEFFSAYVSAPLQPVVSADEDRGKVLVTFTRKPQRWLVSGETPVVIDKINTSKWYGYVTNPTMYPSKPRLEISFDTSAVASDTNNSAVICRIGGDALYSGPSVYMRSSTLKMNEMLDGITNLVIDCEKQFVYSPDVPDRNLNQYVVLGTGAGDDPSEITNEYPTIPAGRNIYVFPKYKGVYTLYPRYFDI